MPYIGRELDRGNYLKLDDISSSFDSSTTTFNLTNGGKAFYPGSAFSILVVLAGVVQEPETAYQINQAQITFASAPLAGDQFFCIALGVALGVNTPANGSVNGTQLAKPFNYDGYFYLDDTNNRVGIATATPQKPLHVVGEGQFDSVRVLGDLTVDGTTTTLDTVVTEVDKLEISANNSTVGVAITQTGTGDIFNLYDGSTEVFSVRDGGNVGIKNATGLSEFPVDVGGEIASKNSSKEFIGINLTNNEARIRSSYYSGASGAYRPITFYTSDTERLRIHASGKFSFGTGTASAAKYTFNSAGTNEVARFESTDAGAYLAIKDNSSTSINFVEGGGDVLSLGVNSVERLRITTSGVGIGSATPQSQFEVHGTSPIIRSKHSTSQKYTQINHNGTDGYLDWSSGGLIFRGASNAERLRIASDGVITGRGELRLTEGTSAVSNGDEIGSLMFTYPSNDNKNAKIVALQNAGTSGADLAFFTRTHGDATNADGGEERLRITSAGLVGINCTPLSILHTKTSGGEGLRIQGTASSAFIRFTDGSNNSTGYFGQDGTFSIVNQRNTDMRFKTNDVERLRITSDGRIGIGMVPHTSSTGYALQIDGGASSFIQIFNDTSGNTVNDGLVIGNDANTAYLVNKENTPLIFRTNNTEQLRLDSNGYLGLNNSAPHNQYYNNLVIGDGSASGDKGITIRTQSSNEGVIAFSDADSGAARYAGKIAYNHGTNSMMFFTTNGDERLRINSGGQISIRGTNTAFDTTGDLNSLQLYYEQDSGQASIGPYSNGGNTHLSFYTNSGGAAATEKLRITSNGDVGIDCIPNDHNNFSRVLDVNGPSGAAVYMRTNDSTSNVFIVGNYGSDAYLNNRSNGNLRLYTNSSERIRITNTGRVGINTTTPTVSLDLSNNTDAVALPTGTTAQRPSGTDAYIRKNSTNNALEFYNGTEWVEIITDYFPTGSTILG